MSGCSTCTGLVRETVGMVCQTCGTDYGRLPAVRDTHTPPRSVRIPTPLWEAAKAKAAERGETVTDVVVRALERYVKR